MAAGSVAAAQVAAVVERAGDPSFGLRGETFVVFVIRKVSMRTLKRLLVVVALTSAAVATSGCSYNRFVSQEEAIKAQWAQVENQLQLRNDLIPNLV